MLNTLVEGSGPTLVWGHGLQGSIACEQASGLFHSQHPRLRRVRFDARGHGESAADHDPSAYTWPRLGQDMLDVARQQTGDQRVALGGQSMGCATALHAALLAPERVTRLVLVIPPTAWRSRAGQVEKYLKAVSLLERRGMNAFMQASRLFPAFPPWLRDARPHLEPARLEALTGFSAQGLIPILQGAAQSDLPPIETLEALRMPTLILAWPDDGTHPLGTALQLEEALPHSSLVVAQSSAEVDHWPDLIEDFVMNSDGRSV